MEDDAIQDEEAEVRNFVKNGEWDRQILKSVISEEMVELILQTLKPLVEGYQNDISWWMVKMNSQFIVKSAWESIGKRKEKKERF